ncbi:hypothetical protein RRG08_003216 [Elysia crispata]|uniref:Uncharacterized protein n=1 Tax=Elysia crispata TaxID=231223 RepID=A0AAE1AGU7_9GAST|nr:hypothetical protein RRG08_003216 [Elysia crispata]
MVVRLSQRKWWGEGGEEEKESELNHHLELDSGQSVTVLGCVVTQSPPGNHSGQSVTIPGCVLSQSPPGNHSGQSVTIPGCVLSQSPSGNHRSIVSAVDSICFSVTSRRDSSQEERTVSATVLPKGVVTGVV